MVRILVADDDAAIREMVGIFLQREGFEVIEAEDGQEALELLESTKVDAVILDVMMPNVDGYEVCSLIRQYTDLPILMLTAKSETRDKLKGFAVGSDDYLVKPFEPFELVARVKALLRRYRVTVSSIVQIGNLTLDRRDYIVTAGDETMTLPLKEFELLYKLASQPNKTFTREQLIEDIWGLHYEGDYRTVDVHIRRLRERFPEDKSGLRIVTTRGLGYRVEAVL